MSDVLVFLNSAEANVSRSDYFLRYRRNKTTSKYLFLCRFVYYETLVRSLKQLGVNSRVDKEKPARASTRKKRATCLKRPDRTYYNFQTNINYVVSFNVHHARKTVKTESWQSSTWIALKVLNADNKLASKTILILFWYCSKVVPRLPKHRLSFLE